MSLFPAYSEGSSIPEPSTSAVDKEPKESNKDSWLTNSSFIPFQSTSEKDINENKSTSALSDNDGGLDEQQEILYDTIEKDLLKKKKKKKHKKSSHKRKHNEAQDEPIKKLEFTGDEDYYVDYKPCKGYLVVNKLHRPACPKYKIHLLPLGIYFNYNKDNAKSRRYFFKRKTKKSDNASNADDSEIENISGDVNAKSLNQEEFSAKSKDLNRKISLNLRNVDLWIELVKHQDQTPIKCTKTQLAEMKMEIIERALIHNARDEKLYKLYIDICNSTFPSFEVSKFLDVLLAKDPANYILWSAQILASQGSMARCVVPDVLKLYEECMQKMYRKCQDDEIMIKLFTSCALFLRQSGLNEQFFALLKLALELNVDKGEKFQRIQPLEYEQKNLIEYEEVILKSGLPMNEIWLRIEKLRQNFYFLPLPPNTTNPNDPQRLVFNEDICFFIYPLTHRENGFALVLIILRLLKVPFIIPSSLRKQFLFAEETLNEFDATEEILATFLYETTTQSSKNFETFDRTLYELIKETSIGPSFISSHIGHECYLRAITEIILLCAECCENERERRRIIFMLIWLRFERILIKCEKYAGKLTPELMKKCKTKIKNALKEEKNRNVLNFYIEYALIEYEFGNLKVVENIFVTSITASKSIAQNSDISYAYVTYAEILMKQQNYTKALKVLMCFALDISLEEIENSENFGDAKKLSALKRLTDRLNDLIAIEKNVQIMELEQYFLPDYVINLIKAKIYCQILLNRKLEALESIERILRHFSNTNSRHLFLKEMIYEFYINVLQISEIDKTCFISNMLIYKTISIALKDFPENLFILKICAILEGQPWYKIRSLLMKCNSPISIIFLIASGKWRCEKFVITSYMQETYRTRIANILNEVIDRKSPLRKNSLMWRLYLRSLCDMQSSFEKSRNKLFEALDECPWNKALYLDGCVVVPQELAQLQDLIIEKQMRLYAISEELEILREDTFQGPKKIEDNANEDAEDNEDS